MKSATKIRIYCKGEAREEVRDEIGEMGPGGSVAEFSTDTRQFIDSIRKRYKTTRNALS